MFRIVCDPSPGSIELYLTEIIRSGSLIFVVCLVAVWQRNFEPAVCVYVRYNGLQPVVPTHTPLVQNYAARHRPITRQTSVNHYEKFQSSTSPYSLMMDRIRSETCWSGFCFVSFKLLYNVDFNLEVLYS